MDDALPQLSCVQADHSHIYSKVALQQAQACTAPPGTGTGEIYVHTQLLTKMATPRGRPLGRQRTNTTHSLAICSTLLHYVQHTTHEWNSECPNTQHTPHTVVRTCNYCTTPYQ